MIHKRQTLSPSECREFAKDRLGINISVPTIIKYARKFKIGYQIPKGVKGAQWRIKQDLFIKLIRGERLRVNRDFEPDQDESEESSNEYKFFSKTK